MATDPDPPASRAPIEARLRDAGLPPLARPAWLEVDLDVLAGNARVLRSMLPAGTRLGAVVKADGYGHGLLASSHAALEGGASLLAVATLDEALAMREAGIEAPVVVLFSVPRDGIGEAISAGVELVAMDGASVEALASAVGRGAGGSPGMRVHLGIDTGMTRGGLLPDEAVVAARRLLDAGLLHLAGTWTHLASPEDREATARQVAAFDGGLAALTRAGIDPGLRHVNSTGGVLDDVSPGWDLARVGLGFYGHLPGDVRIAPERAAAAASLRPALTLRARAISIEHVPAGTAVGYGGTWRAERPSTVAVLPVGYADGWIRRYAGATVRVRDVEAPLVGRVSMDAIAVDVTGVTGFGPDDEVVVAGPPGAGGSSVEDLARRRDSISWEVIAGFSPRLARVYLSGDRPVAVRQLDGRLRSSPGFRLRTAVLPGDPGVGAG